MEPESRQPDPAVDLSAIGADVLEQLQTVPTDFTFFQAVRWMQRLSSSADPMGAFRHPLQEPMQLATHASLAFPAGEIQAFDFDRDGPPKMTVNFFGLHGALGVLPTRYTELIIERAHL